MSILLNIQDPKYGTPFFPNHRIFLGEGIFETLRVVNSRPCYSELHWLRLQRAALFLQLPFELSYPIWREKLDECIVLHQLQEGGIKALLGAGSASRGLLAKSKETHLVVDAFNYQSHNGPVKLVSASWLRDGKNPIYQLKSINYLEAIIACRQAVQAGADDVLFFNLEQYATDTTIANLFIIKNNQVLTPALHHGVLAGIARQRLLLLCEEHNIPWFECDLDKSALMQADAVFVSNVLLGIRPVSIIDNAVFNTDHWLVTQLQNLLASDQRSC